VPAGRAGFSVEGGLPVAPRQLTPRFAP